MLAEEELKTKKSGGVSAHANYKTTSTQPTPTWFSSFSTPPPEINSETSNVIPDASSYSTNTDELLDMVIGTYASSFSGMGSSGGIKIDDSNVNGDGSSGDVITDLINLILGIIELPMRFAYMAKALGESTGALGLGIAGLSQSFALGTKDIYLLIIAVLQIVFSNIGCMIRFIFFTLFGGCIIIHVITFFFILLYLLVVAIFDKIRDNTGINFSATFDLAVDIASSNSIVEFFGLHCYSCDGRNLMKLDSILADVGVIQDIGNMISYDFNNTMPGYMRTSIPLGTAALNSLDKAMN